MSTLFLQFLQNIITKQKGSPGTAVSQAHKGGRVTCQPSLTLCEASLLLKNYANPWLQSTLSRMQVTHLERQCISSQNEEKKTQMQKPVSYTTVSTKQNQTIVSHDYTVSHFKFIYDEHSLTLSVLKFKNSSRKCYQVFRWNWSSAENQAIKMPEV